MRELRWLTATLAALILLGSSWSCRAAGRADEAPTPPGTVRLGADRGPSVCVEVKASNENQTSFREEYLCDQATYDGFAAGQVQVARQRFNPPLQWTWKPSGLRRYDSTGALVYTEKLTWSDGRLTERKAVVRARRQDEEDQTSTYTYAYDETTGRLKAETSRQPDGEQKVEYGYDPQGRLVSEKVLQRPDGYGDWDLWERADYSYGKDGRVAQRQSIDPDDDEVLETAVYTYTEAGLLATEKRTESALDPDTNQPRSWTITYEYDDAGRLTRQRGPETRSGPESYLFSYPSGT